jgi:hypothetical protein
MTQIYACILCDKTCDDQQISLTNGKVLHHTCHDALKNELAKCGDLITEMDSRIVWLEERIRHANSIFYKLRRVMGGEVINIDVCEQAISRNKSNLAKLVKKRDETVKVITLIYDYWPSYPPDWEDRKKTARSGIRSCDRCHSSKGTLHVHHRQPISNGGNHKLDNLTVICEKCHSIAHGGRKFDYEDNSVESSFEKKLVILRSAIAREQMIRFSYTRRDGRKSVRTLLPHKFETVENSLCVHGYCYLRKEQRTFSIKRMRSLRQVTDQGDCYYK